MSQYLKAAETRVPLSGDSPLLPGCLQRECQQLGNHSLKVTEPGPRLEGEEGRRDAWSHSCLVVGRLSHQPHLLFRTGFALSKMKDPRQEPETPPLSLFSWSTFYDQVLSDMLWILGNEISPAPQEKELSIIQWREQAQRGETTCKRAGQKTAFLPAYGQR